MALWLFLLWIVFNGRITLELCLIGAAISVALSWFAHHSLTIAPWTKLCRWRRLPGVLCYLCYLVGQVILSNLQVIKLILAPGKGRGKLVWFQTKLTQDGSRLALANSITLTPGTVTVAMKQGQLCVYVLRGEMALGLKGSSFEQRLEKLEERND